MPVFTEIFLTEDINERSEAIFNEEFPGRKIVSDQGFLEIRLSRLYGRSDQDYKRIKRNMKNSIFFNLDDYDPNYYYQDLLTTSQEEYDSLERHRSSIIPFADNKSEKNKKIKTFNVSQDNARFSVHVKRSLGSEGNVYFNNKEPKSYNDINFTDISEQVINDSFDFISPDSTKVSTSIDYPFYANDYEINKLGSAIYPMNVLREIQLTHLSLKNIKGIKASIGWKDIRNRCFLMMDHINLKENLGLEPYDDEGIPDLLMAEKKIEINRFLLTHDSGDFVPSIDTNNSIEIQTISQQKNYLSNEKDNITPFKEDESINKDIHFDNTDRVNIDDDNILNIVTAKTTQTSFIPKNKDQYMSFGSDINYEYSHGIESIAFKGLMD